ncbi:MAG: class I SAM-dependent methyltransferase [Agrobacterium sp.]|nr:class I SAM-dependent methyltransferase [Agrobacterium sp.]
MDSASFYREFEAKFRGSRDEITGRLTFYLPFLRLFLLAGHERPRLVDLGCGRGEWLELAGSIGFEAEGVDLDDGMLCDCRERGLNARREDAIARLRALPDSSQAVVSGFHIAEHLPFDVLQTLIIEANRVLIPGGLLILETPNAENIHVGTLTFHMDPTHNKPLPPGLLSFLPRIYGFDRSKVFRLQENRLLAQAPSVRLIDVLTGVSPDYAVIAQKPADAAFLQRFDAIFDTAAGLTLDTLAERFENAFVRKADLPLENYVTLAAFEELVERMRDLAGQNDAQRQQIEAIYASTSWRLTWPMRSAVRLVRRLLSPLPAVTTVAVPPSAPETGSEEGLTPETARIFQRLKNEAEQRGQ